MLVVGVSSLSTLLPSAPGFLGPYQYAYALVLSLLGYESGQGVAAATAVQLFLMGSLTIVGLCTIFYCLLGKEGKFSGRECTDLLVEVPGAGRSI